MPSWADGLWVELPPVENRKIQILNKIVRCPSDVWKRRQNAGRGHFTLNDPTKRRAGTVKF